MSLRTTLALVVLAIAVGVVAYINPFSSDEKKEPEPPWFYQVAMDDIETIAITHKGDRESFLRVAKDTWAFEDPEGIPPTHRRWGGMTLLLSGPQTRRDLTETSIIIDDPAQYGLDDAHTVIDVGLTADRSLQVRLGDETTDGKHLYSQVIGFEQLFLVAASWGGVMSRLATEPPYPKWYIKRPPEEIEEVNIYLGDRILAETPRLRFKLDRDTGVWSVRDFDNDAESRAIDMERWSQVLPLVGGPTDVSVVVPKVEDLDYTPWGILEDTKGIELRYAKTDEDGITYIDGMFIQVGHKIPDQDGYYGKSVTDISTQPVLFLDANWVETLLGLFDDIPYGEETDSQASDRSG